MKTKPLLISLKPTYANLVFRGLKTAELRRKFSEHYQNREVFVYVSSPVRKLRGGFRVGKVWAGSPEEIWRRVSTIAEVSRRVFDKYYEGQNMVFALEILNAWEYADARSLIKLKEQFPGFVVPQSYRRLTSDECRSFRNLKRKPVGSKTKPAA